jgi:uncharacterized membrane protein
MGGVEISINLLLGTLIILITIILTIFAKQLHLNKEKGMKFLFFLLILTIISLIISYYNYSVNIFIIGSLYMYVAFAFIIMHSSKVLGNKKTFLFIAISALFSLTAEILGVKYGWIFGNYYYTGTGLLFNLVPLLLPISWAVIVYISYTITNLFLYGFGGEKPRYNHHLLFLVGFLVLLSAIDGLIAMNLDMIMDPVAVSPLIQQWVWIDGGPYFGIPISNFLGWFAVTFTITLLFRLYESFTFKKESSTPNLKLYAYAPALYFLYFLQQSAQAVTLNYMGYVLIAATCMMPFIIIPLMLYMVIFLNSKPVK